ncbi:MAG: hypothetical protein D6800_04120 [Candidatus Zixiibacteriota bacterium]|nr:MAG: hypothetical protein D6800_04120 [candidate division Zixibacteria bacterium]
MATRKTRTRRAFSRRTTTRKANTRTARRRASNGGQPWSRQEIAFLRKNYRNHSTAWCAKELGRTVYAVRYKASDLSIKKANPSKWVDFTPARKTRSPKKRWAKPTTRRSMRRTAKRRTSRSRARRR